MCRHIVNATFAFQAPCCRRWFDCSECHFEATDHRLEAAAELALLCRACERPFRKILSALDAEDDSCPHCSAALVVATIRERAASITEDSSSSAEVVTKAASRS
ncbi:hypothetical protein PybrP1_010794 [[Pythium] brassicae (nom. inval.)]|nr:hypothetical protein PybrP1_010794 [[Pythium] brassicae (nom. inval.)]